MTEFVCKDGTIHSLKLVMLSECRFLPEDVRIYGFARSEMTDGALRERIKGYVKGEDAAKANFLERVSYVQGTSHERPPFATCVNEVKCCEHARGFAVATVGHMMQLCRCNSALNHADATVTRAACVPVLE
jgi:glucose-6-phosphate 1-dehydrogenase